MYYEGVLVEVLNFFVNNFTAKDFIMSIVSCCSFWYFLYNKNRKEYKEDTNMILEKHLISEETVNGYIDKLNKNLNLKYYIYKKWLKQIIDFITRILGKLELLNFKTYEKVFYYSYLYSIFFFFVNWLINGNGSIGNIEIFKDDLSFRIMFFSTIGFSIFFLLIILVFKIFIKNNQYLLLHKKEFHFDKDQLIFDIILFGSMFISFVIFGSDKYDLMFFMAYFSYIAILFLVIWIPLFVIFLIKDLSKSKSKIIKLLIISSILMFIAILSMFEYKGFIISLIFLIILPLINSLFDYISIYFSRFFAYKILNTNSIKEIFVDLCKDLILAIILLIALSVSLYYSIYLVNIYLINDKELLIPIQHYKDIIFQYKLFDKEVIWITFLFFTTLLPTLFHLIIVIIASIENFFIKPDMLNLIEELKLLKQNKKNLLQKEKIAKKLVKIRQKEDTHFLFYNIMNIVLLFLFLISGFLLLLKLKVIDISLIN